MQYLFILRKYMLKFSLGIFFLLFAVDLYSQEIKELTSKEFYEQYGDQLHDESILIIDGRTEAMFAGERIGSAVNIDADSEDLVEQLQQHLDQSVIVVYCTTIRRTKDIVNKLKGIYEGEILFITDGVRGWKQNNLPVNEGEVITLEEAVEEALSNNNELKSSKMMIEVAGGAIHESEASFLPKVEANFQYAYLDIVPGFKRERLGNIEHTLFPFISAGQEVYSGGRNRLQRESAGLSLEKETKSFEKDVMDVKLSVSLY